MSKKLNIAGKTDTGLKRSKNEDNFFVDDELGFMIVADGMGGHAAGEVASQLAVQICGEQIKRSLQTNSVPMEKRTPLAEGFDPRTGILGDCVRFANQSVHEAANSGEKHKQMGTTLVAALWLDGKLAIANVGDSRLYMVRNGDLTQCTTDHSFVQEQVDQGFLKPEDAERSDLRNMLTRSIGMHEDVKVDLFEVELTQNDYILLCSDGLTKMLDDDQIERAFLSNKEPKAIAEDLISQSLKAGGHDNVTVIVGKVEGPPSSWTTLTDRVKNIFHNKAEQT